jgi:hypothetical protein
MNFIDHHKWLVDNNLLTDEIKDNVAMAAYCIVEDVKNAFTKMDFNNNIVNYVIILPDELYNNIQLLQRYEATKKLGFFEMRRLKKFLQAKKENDEFAMGYKLDDIANKFVKSYLSDKWSARLTIVSEKNYDASKDPWLYSQGDSAPN